MEKNYTVEEVKKACQNSENYRDVLRLLGEFPNQKHTRHIKKFINENNIDISHFKHTSAKTWSNDEIFVKNSPVARNQIRRRILKHNLIA